MISRALDDKSKEILKAFSRYDVLGVSDVRSIIGGSYPKARFLITDLVAKGYLEQRFYGGFSLTQKGRLEAGE